MIYLQIGFWIIIGYIVSIPIGRILFYSAAILHNWCIMVTFGNQYWYNKGTTIKDIYDEISKGDNFIIGAETKYTPLTNILFPLVWLFGELLFFVLIIIISIIRLIIIIIGLLYKLIYVRFLSPLFKPLSNINYKTNWLTKTIILTKTILNNIKKFILNLRIA